MYTLENIQYNCRMTSKEGSVENATFRGATTPKNLKLFIPGIKGIKGCTVEHPTSKSKVENIC